MTILYKTTFDHVGRLLGNFCLSSPPPTTLVLPCFNVDTLFGRHPTFHTRTSSSPSLALNHYSLCRMCSPASTFLSKVFILRVLIMMIILALLNSAD